MRNINNCTTVNQVRSWKTQIKYRMNRMNTQKIAIDLARCRHHPIRVFTDDDFTIIDETAKDKIKLIEDQSL